MGFQLSMSEIKTMRAEIAAHGLIVPPEYSRLSDEQFQEVANGIGPDSFPGFVHDLCDDILFERFLPASGPHDVCYEFGKGTDDDWHSANLAFKYNCEKLVIAGTSWWNVFRRREERRVYNFLFDMVESDKGKESYYTAYRRGPAVKLA